MITDDYVEGGFYFFLKVYLILQNLCVLLHPNTNIEEYVRL